MEEVTKCCYIDCTDPQERDLTLHELPVCNTALCVKWLVNTGHVDLISRDLESLRSMKFFICNNHFSEECYLSKGTLRDSAVPFPHWHNASKKATGHQIRVEEVNSNCQEGKNGSDSGGLTSSKHAAFFTMDAKVQSEAIDTHFAELKENPDLWCRTCAMRKQTDNLISMTARLKDTDMSLLSKLKLLIEIDEEDALPTKMCDQCVLKLEQSFKFFQQIYIADNTLRRLLSRAEADSGTPSTPSEGKSNEFAEPLLDKGNEYGSEISRGRDLLGFEVVESVRQTRQSRAIVPRTRRLVGRPRGSGSRLSRSSRFARASRTARFSRGARGWRSRGSHNATINGQPFVPEASLIHRQADQEMMHGNEPEQQGQQDLLEEESATVFSILTETRDNDEELSWLDVLNLMSRQSRPIPDGETETRVCCELCHVSFPLRKQLRVHLLSEHLQPSEHMCTSCTMIFSNEAALTEHRICCQRYHCDYCQQGFLEKRALTEHIVNCHDGDESLLNISSLAAKKQCSDNRGCAAVVTASSTQCSIQKSLPREIETAPKSTNSVNDTRVSNEASSNRNASARPESDQIKLV